MKIATVVEPEPLGTGGALLHVCEARGLSGRLIALNGDSYLDGGLADLRAVPHEAVVAAVEVADTARYGRLEIDSDGRIRAFREKGVGGPGRINAGLYRLPVESLAQRPAGAFSVERDVLPPLAAAGELWQVPISARFIDIGIPSDYERFRRLAAELRPALSTAESAAGTATGS
jgi:NDP-sugar pyrophosphorylase family protein